MKYIQFFMIMAMIAWGSNWISAKILMSYMDVYELIFWRFLLAFISLFLILLFLKVSFLINLKEIFYAFLSAVILGIYNYFFFLGDHLASAALGGVLVTTLNPIITFLIIALLNRKRLKRYEIISLILGVTGSFLIIKIWNFSLNKGVVFFLLASFTWPLLTILSSKIEHKNSLVFSFYMFLFTTLIIFFIFLKGKIAIPQMDIKGYFNLFALSIYGTSFATAAYFLGSSILGGKKASSYIFIVPLSAVIFSSIFFNERIDLFLVIGGIISLSGVYLLNGFNLLKGGLIEKFKD